MGFTLADETGALVAEDSIWQFNFHFDLEKDKCNENTEAFLKKAGIDFAKLKSDGISHEHFAEQIMASGLVCNPDFRWIVFHGSFDFAYFIKMVRGDILPQQVAEFFQILKIFFPKIYDIKSITEKVSTLGNSLSSYGQKLDVGTAPLLAGLETGERAPGGERFGLHPPGLLEAQTELAGGAAGPQRRLDALRSEPGRPRAGAVDAVEPRRLHGVF